MHTRGHGQPVLRIAGADPGVHGVNGVVTVQLGPSQVVAALRAEIEDALSTTQAWRDTITQLAARSDD